jgi:hypothetical protein
MKDVRRKWHAGISPSRRESPRIDCLLPPYEENKKFIQKKAAKRRMINKKTMKNDPEFEFAATPDSGYLISRNFSQFLPQLFSRV